MASRFNGFLGLTMAMVLLAGLITGCNKVTANYPPQSTPTPYIPEERVGYKGRSSPIVWDEPDEVRGFLDLTQDFSDRARAFDNLAERTGSSVHRREAKDLGELASEGLAMAYVSTYFGKGIERKVETGDLELIFADGTRCRDRGVLAWIPGNAAQRFRSTRDGQVTLSGAKLDRGEQLIVWVLYDRDNLKKDIKKIRIVDDG